MTSPNEGVVEDDEPFKCWCGVVGRYDEMFMDVFSSSCCGTGHIDCLCGGDQCVCHNHGETECPGCEDCEDAEDGEDGYTLGFEYDPDLGGER